MIWRLLTTDSGLGYLPQWDAVRADRAAEATERLLLGWAGPARVETAADRVRRQRAEAQGWKDRTRGDL